MINMAIGSPFINRASHGSIAGKAVNIAPMINRNIVPGVRIDEMNKNKW